MKKTITYFAALLICVSTLITPVAASVPTESKTATSASSEPQPDKVIAAIREFKSLSRQERKARIKEAKKVLKQYKADKKEGRAEPETSTVLLVILAIILPPLAVYLHEGVINSKFWIDLVLTLLFFIPGVIYALLVVLNAV